MSNKNLRNALTKFNQLEKMQTTDVVILSSLSANIIRGGLRGTTCDGKFTCGGTFSCTGGFTCTSTYSTSPVDAEQL